jgi:hypothetical protein
MEVVRCKQQRKHRGFDVKKITAVIAMMCALSAYASYPSATTPTSAGLSPLATSMQESRSLPIEAYDAV